MRPLQCRKHQLECGCFPLHAGWLSYKLGELVFLARERLKITLPLVSKFGQIAAQRYPTHAQDCLSSFRFRTSGSECFAFNCESTMAMQDVINKFKGTALGVAEYLTPVLKACYLCSLRSHAKLSHASKVHFRFL